MIFDLFFFSRWCFTFYQDRIHYCTGTIAFFFSSRVWTNLPMWIFICSKFSWPGRPWPKKYRLSFWLTNSRVRYKSNVEKSLSAERCRQLWTSRLRDCQFLKSFRVWGWLLPFWWRVNLIQWQFLGEAPAHMPMHQVVHSLQRRLAESSVWAPQMVSRWHVFLFVSKSKVEMVKEHQLENHLRWFLIQLYTYQFLYA